MKDNMIDFQKKKTEIKEKKDKAFRLKIHKDVLNNHVILTVGNNNQENIIELKES